MAGRPAATEVPVETLDNFAKSKWPAVLGEWSVAAAGNPDWRTELAPEWEKTVNDPYPLYASGRSRSLEERELLSGMGLVETPKVRIRDKIGFTLFAPEPADYDLFASRVRFTEAGLDLIESAGLVR